MTILSEGREKSISHVRMVFFRCLVTEKSMLRSYLPIPSGKILQAVKDGVSGKGSILNAIIDLLDQHFDVIVWVPVIFHAVEIDLARVDIRCSISCDERLAAIPEVGIWVANAVWSELLRVFFICDEFDKHGK